MVSFPNWSGNWCQWGGVTEESLSVSVSAIDGASEPKLTHELPLPLTLPASC